MTITVRTEKPHTLHVGKPDTVGLGTTGNPETGIDAEAPQVRYRGGGGIPGGGQAGDVLAKRTNGDGDVVWVTPTNKAESDNTLPITSAGVYREIGNINVLLSTI